MTFYSLPLNIPPGSIRVQGIVIESCPVCDGSTSVAEIARLIEQMDFVGYESKGRPLELDPNFKRLAEIFEVKIWPYTN